MNVALLTEEQAEQLRGQQYANDCYFNPIQDKNGQWVISIEEMNQCTIEWVKQLELIEYEPIIHEEI
jgi:hypothetical protein